MKEIKLYIGIIAVLLTAMLTGCSDSIADSEPSKDETEEGYYTASFNVSIPNFEQQVTRSTVFMNEGIPKDSMKLFCFDNEGQFIGFGKVREFKEIKGFTRDNMETFIRMEAQNLIISMQPYQTKRPVSIWLPTQEANTKPSTGATRQIGWVCMRICS